MKKLFEQYGGVITTVIAIVALIGIISLTIAGPNGGWVGEAFAKVVDGFNEKTTVAVDSIGSSNSAADDTPVVIKGVVPLKAFYYRGVTSTATGDYTGAAETLKPGDTMPEIPATGDIFVYGDYEYRYNSYYSGTKWVAKDTDFDWEQGWGVRVLDATKTSYGAILENISDKPIINVRGTFRNCTNLIEAPAIPNGVIAMVQTFLNCTALEKAPVIPDSVEEMNQAFSKCTSLKTAPALPEEVEDIYMAFYNCTALENGPTAITSGVVNMAEAFYGCTSLKYLPDFSNATGLMNMQSAFAGCTKITGNIELNFEYTGVEMSFCLQDTVEPITITGIAPATEKEALAESANNGNASFS